MNSGDSEETNAEYIEQQKENYNVSFAIMNTAYLKEFPFTGLAKFKFEDSVKVAEEQQTIFAGTKIKEITDQYTLFSNVKKTMNEYMLVKRYYGIRTLHDILIVTEKKEVVNDSNSTSPGNTVQTNVKNQMMYDYLNFLKTPNRDTGGRLAKSSLNVFNIDYLNFLKTPNRDTGGRLAKSSLNAFNDIKNDLEEYDTNLNTLLGEKPLSDEEKNKLVENATNATNAQIEVDENATNAQIELDENATNTQIILYFKVRFLYDLIEMLDLAMKAQTNRDNRESARLKQFNDKNAKLAAQKKEKDDYAAMSLSDRKKKTNRETPLSHVPWFDRGGNAKLNHKKSTRNRNKSMYKRRKNSRNTKVRPQKATRKRNKSMFK